ncbi:hypothetical protein ACIGGF_19935 [Rhodococcus sp. NPDC078407]|uniref:hypothetical protein n=1 Tax=Rhodococcus sp. NPDC078407 TaxID=3364509 RepID=UPI0037CB9DBC
MSSELWLLRTCFGENDDTTWMALTESARSTRSSVTGAGLVVSSDRQRAGDAIRASLRWRSDMARDGVGG